MFPKLEKCVQKLEKCVQKLEICVQNLEKCVQNLEKYWRRYANHTQIRAGIKPGVWDDALCPLSALDTLMYATSASRLPVAVVKHSALGSSLLMASLLPIRTWLQTQDRWPSIALSSVWHSGHMLRFLPVPGGGGSSRGISSLGVSGVGEVGGVGGVGGGACSAFLLALLVLMPGVQSSSGSNRIAGPPPYAAGLLAGAVVSTSRGMR